MSNPVGYLSICSGIEAASVAWHPLGWRAIGFAELVIGPPPPCVAADGPHYKALGNSMAVPVMAWLGRRIDAALKGAA